MLLTIIKLAMIALGFAALLLLVGSEAQNNHLLFSTGLGLLLTAVAVYLLMEVKEKVRGPGSRSTG